MNIVISFACAIDIKLVINPSQHQNTEFIEVNFYLSGIKHKDYSLINKLHHHKKIKKVNKKKAAVII